MLDSAGGEARKMGFSLGLGRAQRKGRKKKVKTDERRSGTNVVTPCIEISFVQLIVIDWLRHNSVRCDRFAFYVTC